MRSLSPEWRAALGGALVAAVATTGIGIFASTATMDEALPASGRPNVRIVYAIPPGITVEQGGKIILLPAPDHAMNTMVDTAKMAPVVAVYRGPEVPFTFEGLPPALKAALANKQIAQEQADKDKGKAQ